MSEPNFFIIGTTKGGTSSLHLWLNQHPDISLSRPKELHYFCRCPNPALHVASSWDDYIGRFADNKVRGEASPCYVYDRGTARALTKRFPQAKLLVSLRDPVERFWSHYLMNEVYRPTGRSAEVVLEQNLRDGHSDALTDLFGMGLYGRQLGEYFRLAGRDRVHVTHLERLEQNPDREIEDILAFLDVTRLPLDTQTQDKQYVEPRGPLGRVFLRNPRVRSFGVTILPPSVRRFLRTRLLGTTDGKPQLPASLRDKLRELYTEDSQVLEELVEQPLPWRWHLEANTAPLD